MPGGDCGAHQCQQTTTAQQEAIVEEESSVKKEAKAAEKIGSEASPLDVAASDIMENWSDELLDNSHT